MRELARRGLIPDGTVDARSVTLIEPGDLRGFTQCHFFAGIAGWPLALQRAGWPAGRPVWSASLPCQPFSAAGQQRGTDDDRHLWPVFRKLVLACLPPIIFGEQVASPLVTGGQGKHRPSGKAGAKPDGNNQPPWLDVIQIDLEAMGYAVGAVPFPAAGVGAPHLRDRLYWVAERLADSDLSAGRQERAHRGGSDEGNRAGQVAGPGRDGVFVGLGDADDPRSQGHARDGGAEGRQGPARSAAPAGVSGGLAHAHGVDTGHPGIAGGEESAGVQRGAIADGCGEPGAERPSPINGFWGAADWLLCRDGRWRPAQPGIFPLVARLPEGVGRGGDRGFPVDADATQEGRLHRLRGYGNSINIEAAVAFIRAYLEK